MPPANDALVKHAIRHSLWLPACKRRRKILPANRQLEYFTFVGNRPLDVLLLAVEQLLPHSADRGYSAVKFFDRNGDDTSRTQKLIPGAQAFGGSFTRTMLVDEATAVEEPGRVATRGSTDREEYDLLCATQKQFRKYFPFDVINFDLEAVPFRQDEQPPGLLLRTLKKMFLWQAEETDGRSIDAFSLMLTIPLVTPTLDPSVMTLLRNVVQANLERFPHLEQQLLTARGIPTVDALEQQQWETMFAVAMPKVIFDSLFSSGWALSSDDLVRVARRERQVGGVTEVLYHLILDVERAPRGSDPRSRSSYAAAVEMLMEHGATAMSSSDVTSAVRTSYEKVVAREQAAELGGF